jgi:hypothetical protein
MSKDFIVLQMWLDLEQEMTRHLRMSMDVIQSLTEEEYNQRLFERCQEGVRELNVDKKEKNRLLKANRKSYQKSCRKLAKKRAKEAMEVGVEMEIFNQNNNYVGKWMVDGEEVDWDDQIWDEMNAWIF